MLYRLKTRFFDFKISTQFILFFFFLLVSSLLISNIIYQKIYNNITINKISSLSIQSLSSIKLSFDSTINNINSYSKLILSDENIQLLLRSKSFNSDLHSQDKARQFLYKLIQEVPSISSVHIFDVSGNELSIENKGKYIFKPENITKASWYDEAIANRGAYILKLNGNDNFEYYSEYNFISMVREIRDVNTTEHIGVLVLNISASAFKDLYLNNLEDSSINFISVNENNDSIISSNVFNKFEIENIFKDSINESGNKFVFLNKEEYLASFLKYDKFNWKLISLIPIKKLSNENFVANIAGFVIIFLNGIFLFAGSILISKMLTNPLNKLLNSMKNIEKGTFKEVDIKVTNHEINKLKHGYNFMVSEIQKLFDKTIKDQQHKRNLELSALQAQIKPHFLYNTLDSISSLALLDRTDEVCDLIDALGNYYRKSLSSGREIITLKEELDIVINYLKIQKTRYTDLFDVFYSLDNNCNTYKIPKLILQPLIENAIYHGIRNKKGFGIIKISTLFSSEKITIIIEDNGIGMTPEELNNVLHSESDEITHFGLTGTIKRLELFYNQHCFDIESSKNKGTKIVLTIPLKLS